MTYKQSSWPFILLLLFLVIGLPMIDRQLKKHQQEQQIEIQIEEPIIVASL